MKSAVIVFPGSNCDRDAQVALRQVTGSEPAMVWHKDAALPQGLDLIVLPGGFSYGDYLRSGAMAAASPIGQAIRAHADRGGYVLAICNGFQVATELRILPGALLRNASLNFVCRPQPLAIATNSAFTAAYGSRRDVSFPIAHHDGNYFADEETLDRLEGEGRVAFRYTGNPNGSARDIAGVLSENGRVLGMMPHPERAIGGHEGGSDGLKLFESVMAAA
ncbi:MAG: phosphoribosylformylglycinamidine synthase subunit PurQ [Alphaproteobacteria bacterium]|nr:phosphoribosylformylglycinamidine synthase subunit PurQ [Alphaproteobacteria bacterium]